MKALLYFLVLLSSTATFARGVYQSPEDFLKQQFRDKPPKPHLVWLTGDVRPTVEKILGHRPDSLRIRYWPKGDGSVWILNEIGKEKPITAGIVIKNKRIDLIRVLIFRESRGWEIREAFFTRQFRGASLVQNQRLDREIDGISGATLSVRAIHKLARLALYLDTQTRKSP